MQWDLPSLPLILIGHISTGYYYCSYYDCGCDSDFDDD